MIGAPKFWRVSIGADYVNFRCRSRARGFMIICRARGEIPTIRAHWG